MCELELEDDDWIKKIEEEDKLYNDFYYEKNESVLIYYLYINLNNEIGHIKKENFILKNSTMYKEKLLYLLRTNSIFNDIRYSLLTIHQYNIDLLPEEVLLYLKSPKNYNFFNKISISDIKFQDTISLFQDLNSIYIVYKERKKKLKDTKRIYSKKRNNKTKKLI
ncbi:MAG TPA: hypothetical protein EYQ68_02345 [Cytophagales bacterium]|nr:hypothetical protein [Cytophagales bacterium]